MTPLTRTALALGAMGSVSALLAVVLLPLLPGLTYGALLIAAGTGSLACALTAVALARIAGAERVRRLEREALVEELQEMLSQFEGRLYEAERQAAEALAERRRDPEAAAPMRAPRKLQ